MKWFQRKNQEQPKRNEPVASEKTLSLEKHSSDKKESEPQELLLLLIRPSLPKIFESPPDNSVVDADVIMASFGMYNAKGMSKYLLETIPTLCISESGNVGYTIPMRLDLHLCLGQIAAMAKPPIDYPLGLFTNRDVMVVADGLYTVLLMYRDASAAMRAIGDKTNEFPASKIIWAGTTIDEGDMTNLRRLEATAKHLLTPEPATPPKLPPEVASDWLHGFLEPIFKRAREARQESA